MSKQVIVQIGNPAIDIPLTTDPFTTVFEAKTMVSSATFAPDDLQLELTYNGRILMDNIVLHSLESPYI